jgi:hypothetical protein
MSRRRCVHHKSSQLELTVCVCDSDFVIVSPERSDFVSSSNVPYSERRVAMLHCLDVESKGGNRRDHFAELESV